MCARIYDLNLNAAKRCPEVRVLVLRARLPPVIEDTSLSDRTSDFSRCQSVKHACAREDAQIREVLGREWRRLSSSALSYNEEAKLSRLRA